MDIRLEVKLLLFKEEKNRLLKELANMGRDSYDPKFELLTFIIESISCEIIDIKSQIDKSYELNKAKKLDNYRN